MKSLQQPAYARRLSSRLNTGDDVWVYWRCNGRDDVSRVRDLSMKGLFLDAEEPRAMGATIRLHFLVQEGQIRADAAVQHAKSGAGLGLKFMAMTPEDCTHLAALLTRLRQVGSIPQRPVIKELTVSQNTWATQAAWGISSGRSHGTMARRLGRIRVESYAAPQA